MVVMKPLNLALLLLLLVSVALAEISSQSPRVTDSSSSDDDISDQLLVKNQNDEEKLAAETPKEVPGEGISDADNDNEDNNPEEEEEDEGEEQSWSEEDEEGDFDNNENQDQEMKAKTTKAPKSVSCCTKKICKRRRMTSKCVSYATKMRVPCVKWQFVRTNCRGSKKKGSLCCDFKKVCKKRCPCPARPTKVCTKREVKSQCVASKKKMFCKGANGENVNLEKKKCMKRVCVKRGPRLCVKRRHFSVMRCVRSVESSKCPKSRKVNVCGQYKLQKYCHKKSVFKRCQGWGVKMTCTKYGTRRVCAEYSDPPSTCNQTDVKRKCVAYRAARRCMKHHTIRKCAKYRLERKCAQRGMRRVCNRRITRFKCVKYGKRPGHVKRRGFSNCVRWAVRRRCAKAEAMRECVKVSYAKGRCTRRIRLRGKVPVKRPVRRRKCQIKKVPISSRHCKKIRVRRKVRGKKPYRRCKQVCSRRPRCWNYCRLVRYDVHMTTFDGYNYLLRSIGDFLLVKHREFEAWIRVEKLGMGNAVGAAAIVRGNEKIEAVADGNTIRAHRYVRDVKTDAWVEKDSVKNADDVEGLHLHILKNGKEVKLKVAGYFLITADVEFVQKYNKGILDINIGYYDALGTIDVAKHPGLLWNRDGKQSDDAEVDYNQLRNMDGAPFNAPFNGPLDFVALPWSIIQTHGSAARAECSKRGLVGDDLDECIYDDLATKTTEFGKIVAHDETKFMKQAQLQVVRLKDSDSDAEGDSEGEGASSGGETEPDSRIEQDVERDGARWRRVCSRRCSKKKSARKHCRKVCKTAYKPARVWKLVTRQRCSKHAKMVRKRVCKTVIRRVVVGHKYGIHLKCVRWAKKHRCKKWKKVKRCQRYVKQRYCAQRVGQSSKYCLKRVRRRVCVGFGRAAYCVKYTQTPKCVAHRNVTLCKQFKVVRQGCRRSVPVQFCADKGQDWTSAGCKRFAVIRQCVKHSAKRVCRKWFKRALCTDARARRVCTGYKAKCCVKYAKKDSKDCDKWAKRGKCVKSVCRKWIHFAS